MDLAIIFFVLAVAANDRDQDGVADAVDNCVDTPNASQANLDGDCPGDACDVDADGDGMVDDRDNCPGFHATDAADEDEDGIGDACDVCPRVWDPEQADDGERVAGEEPDGIGDACDPHADRGGDRRDEVFLELARPAAHGYARMIRLYRARPGDTWTKIARRFHVEVTDLRRQNTGAQPEADGLVRVPFARLLPVGLAEGITINVPERMLYVVDAGRLEAMMPVAVGRGPTELPEENWSTRTGRFMVTGKREDPTWYVPKSIRGEMARLGYDVVTKVSPGPGNPLGRFAIYTSGGFLLHEAVDIESILEFASHGCIRMMPEDVGELFFRVRNGEPVTVLYEDVKVLQTPEGRVLMEAHPDQYRTFADAMARVTTLMKSIQASKVDRGVVQRVLEARDGRVTDVSRMCAGRVGNIVADCR